MIPGIKKYYSLTKPHVTYGNVLTTAASFLFASGIARRFDFWLFVATVIGTTLVVASACVLNNFYDQDIDRIMERTKTRAVAAGEVKGYKAVIFSILLGVIGIAILIISVNWLTAIIGIIGFITYVWLYGNLSKRRSIHGTLVGAISGAMPIVAGYTAVDGRLDLTTVILFLSLFFWQFPEFYSIAIYRRKEYAKAKIPVMSVVKGVKNTSLQIVIYTILFVLSTLCLTLLNKVGWVYFAAMLVLGIYWIKLSASGLNTRDSNQWARKMFHVALIILMIYCLMLAIGPLLP